MNSLDGILLAVWALVSLVVVVGFGGMIDGLKRSGTSGGAIVVVLTAVGLMAAMIYRGVGYMTPERERWIAKGITAGDSISVGFNPKSRFRSMAHPLGHVLDRNGMVLAEYRLRDGHLVRAYPFGAVASHLIGYWTGPMRDGAGIEKALTLLNDSLKDDHAHDVRLSIDIRLQQEGVQLLAGSPGAIVVMDASSGQILAAADAPAYSPERIWSDDVWREYVTDTERRPLTSRAIKDNFSPGSSIKPLIVAAALHHGSLLPEERGFVCTGSWSPERDIKPISEHGTAHGRVDLSRAMRVSCNIYFARLAYDIVGYEAAADYLESIGFNERLHWNTRLALNRYGTLLPATSWVKARDRIARTRLGIGQASVKTNPIHVAAILGGIANGGRFLRPTVELDLPNDTLPWRMKTSVAATIESLLQEPLKPGGTAASTFPGGSVRGIDVYGKTGTADAEPDGREPSWFVSYGRKNGHTIVVVVAIQNRHGRLAGVLNAPMARRMFERLDRLGYFGG